MAFKSYREASRSNWGREMAPDAAMDRDAIKLGAILRIADATEVMARNYDQLIVERNSYKRWFEQESEKAQRLARSVNALRGVITRMKKAAKA